MLPLTRGLMDTLAPPNQRAQSAPLAPAPLPPSAMHATLTEETERQMIGTMQDLRVDTVEKNRELEEQLLGIVARRDALHTHLVDTVIPTRKERLERQRAALEIALATLEAELSSRITAAFIQHDASLEAPRARMERQGEVEADFYFKEVPHVFEEQCGKAIETMQGERMAHQLSSATIAARESNIEERLGRYETSFRRRGASEKVDRERQYGILETTFSQLFTRVEESARSSAATFTAELAKVTESRESETRAREGGDAAFNSDMVAALTRIKNMALAAYGVEEEEEE